MSKICLPREIKTAFLRAVKDGSINVDEIASLANSEQRREVFARVVGPENASTVNSLFESKLLLKNQRQGMID